VSTILAAGIPLGSYDRCTEAVRTILAGEESPSSLSAWTAGRVKRGNAFTFPQKLMAPSILVYDLGPNEEAEIGQCIEVDLPIQVGFLYEEPFGYYTPMQPSIESVILVAKRLLAKNQRLQIATYGNRSQAERIIRFTAGAPPTYAESSAGVALFQSMNVTYRLTLNRETWDHEN
jgi:hypothetical protein